jgi:hypothetical protein
VQEFWGRFAVCADDSMPLPMANVPQKVANIYTNFKPVLPSHGARFYRVFYIVKRPINLPESNALKKVVI